MKSVRQKAQWVEKRSSTLVTRVHKTTSLMERRQKCGKTEATHKLYLSQLQKKWHASNKKKRHYHGRKS